METREPMINRRHALLLARARSFARCRARLARERAHKIAWAIHPRIRALRHQNPSARPLTRPPRTYPHAVLNKVLHDGRRQCARTGLFGDARGHSRPIGIRVVRCGSHAAARCTAHAAVNVKCAIPSTAVHAHSSSTTCMPLCARQRASPHALRRSHRASRAEAFACKTAH